MAMDAAEIERLIKESIPDARVNIEDLRGDGDHYAATVISAAFAGKTRKIPARQPGSLEAAIWGYAPPKYHDVEEGTLPAAKPGGRCPPEMAFVAGRVCVDKWEGHTVLRAADGILDFAFQLVGLAFGLKFRVAGYLAGGILHGALRLVGHSLDAIVIHMPQSS